MKFNLAFLLSITLSLALSKSLNYNDEWSFPENFLVGGGTSAYQVEGGYNESDKGETVWDVWIHNNPSWVADGNTADIAADSYHKYKEDVAILKDIGFDFYRFSISWSRLLPNGFNNKISEDGLRYYHNLIDEIKSKGLEPFLTIFHIDTPQVFSEFGSWRNELMIDWFVDYARIVFREFGHKVKFFMTINSANVICEKEANTLNAKYFCVHFYLKAHAKVYHMYHDEFRATQNGKVGIIFQCKHYYGENQTDTAEADIAYQYDCGWGAHSIFSKDGDYPKVMRDRIDENSEKEGYSKSKLPKFTQEEIEYIRGSADYFGLNHYSSKIVIPVERDENELWINDMGYNLTIDPSWPETENTDYKVVPEGMRGLLNKIKDEYDNPPVYILENGYSDKETLEDYDRIKFHYSYLQQMLLAIKDGCNVKAYTVWSLIDNYEWGYGYNVRYGIVHVDFKDPERRRTYKSSANWFKKVLAARKLIPIDDYIEQ